VIYLASQTDCEVSGQAVGTRDEKGWTDEPGPDLDGLILARCKQRTSVPVPASASPEHVGLGRRRDGDARFELGSDEV